MQKKSWHLNMKCLRKADLENSKVVNNEYEKKMNEHERLSEKQRMSLNDLNEQLVQANM
jgi:hypothetical protein